MEPHTFSPDGKWMWNGREWIPAPPEHSPPNIEELESNHKNESVHSIQENSSSEVSQLLPESKISAAPLIGTVAIFFSLILPYISIIDIWEYSGLDMIREIVNIFDLDPSNVGNSDNEDVNVSMVYSISIVMFLFSPVVFLLSGFISGLIILGNGSTKTIGVLHGLYTLFFFITVFLYKAQNPYADFIFFEIVGEGFYLGAFAGLLLILD
ncbi:MAG: hypothetical protein DWB99_03650 [Candidatus Poseidoniales archaeon]|nr:MAG: hypothetical protein DWB99_03650 [Candidatus Poseidoniales archaeon]